MLGIDKGTPLLCAKPRWQLSKNMPNKSANIAQKARALVSPYFTKNDFAFAYA